MKISLRLQMLCGLLAFGIFGPAYGLTFLFYSTRMVPPEFNGIASIFLFALSVFSLSILYSRALHAVAPLTPGNYPVHELGAKVVMFGFLDMFNRGLVGTTGLLPLPLRPVLYAALGARIGQDTLLAGVVFEPALMTFGDRVILGQGCIVSGHCTESGVTTIAEVILEDDVTIGANAVLFPGVRIGKGAVVATSSVVTKGTVIPPGEVWGGIPARKLGQEVSHRMKIVG